jgi:UDP-glucuronate 4-epimerase
MRLLVTGGAGFIGSNLIEKLLLLGYNVVCFDNFEPFYNPMIKRRNLSFSLNNKNFKLYSGDIVDLASLEKCFAENKFDMVVHLAAKVGVRQSIQDPARYFSTNLTGTLNVLETMKKYQVKKLVFASSSSVYGNNNKTPFSEEDNVDFPISPYAATKKAGEHLCYVYHHLNNFDIFCLRFFTVYGPRQRPDLAIHRFTDSILKGNPITMFGDGTTVRDYTFVDDIVDGITASINKISGYEIINLGESRTITLKLMIETLENVLNRTAKIVKMPMQPGDVNATYADISKAKFILDYKPSCDFTTGIIQFVNWKLNL